MISLGQFCELPLRKVIEFDPLLQWNENLYNDVMSKNMISKVYEPTSILEVGVRLGYSALAFLLLDSCWSYVGLDCQDDKGSQHGGLGYETFDIISPHFETMFPNKIIHFIKFDTQESKWRSSPYDLVHIDGDHSYDGCLNDLNNFWNVTRKAMIVDDYDLIPQVRNAVDDFISQKKCRTLYHNTRKGDMVLLKG